MRAAFSGIKPKDTDFIHKKIGLNWSDRHGCFVCSAGWHKAWLTHTHPGQHGYWIKWVFVNNNDENWATVRSDEPGRSTASASPFACYLANKRECLIPADALFTCSSSKFVCCCCSARSRLCVSVNSSDCLLSDAESSSSDSPVADKRAPGSERAAERAAQQNERERIRLAPQTSFANMQVHKRIQLTHTHTYTHTVWRVLSNKQIKLSVVLSGIWLWAEKALGNQR